MAENKSLEVLNLDGNELGCTGAQMLSEAIYTNTVLKELHVHLSQNGIKEVTSLGDALNFNKNLNDLFLDGNEVGCEGAQLLSLAFLSNAVLQGLSLSSNNIKNTGVCSLAKGLRVISRLEWL